MTSMTTASVIPLQDALALARTGDLWIFRGSTVVNKVMHAATNSPVNHVGMSVVVEDLPPMLWHSEIGRSMRDVFSGRHHRGAQLHDLREAVQRWQLRYGQRAFLRQLEPEASEAVLDAALLSIGRLDGVGFPSYARLALRWLGGRDGHLSLRDAARQRERPLTAYCAEVVGATLEEMGILSPGAPRSWYDPGRFWSGDTLPLEPGWSYGVEVEVSSS